MKECSICESSCVGLHFGIPACRACAAFFRRTLALNLKYICRFNKSCDVSKKQRYSCRSCRMKKCLDQGMRRELVQASGRDEDLDETSEMEPPSDEPSTSGVSFPYEKIKTETCSAQTSPIASVETEDNIGQLVSNNPDIHASAQRLLKSRLDVLFDQGRPRNYPLNLPFTLSQQALIAYAEHTSRWPNCTKQNVRCDENFLDLDVYMRNMYADIEYVAMFCMAIEPFAQLPKNQKWAVFKQFWPHFCAIDRSFVSARVLGCESNDDRVVTLGGSVFNFNAEVKNLDAVSNMTREQIQELLQSSHETFNIVFLSPFKRLFPDEYELMFIFLSAMFSVKGERVGISDVTKQLAEDVQNRLCEEVHNYYLYEKRLANYASRLYQLSNLIAALEVIQARRKEDMRMTQMFDVFKSDIFMSELSTS